MFGPTLLPSSRTLQLPGGNLNYTFPRQGRLGVELSVLHQSHVQVLRLRGKLTLGQPVDSFRQTFERALEAGDTRFILNLADVPLLDSSGIGALVRCHVSAHRRGGNIKLVHPQDYILRILKMLGLLDLFQVYESEEDAAASFES